MLLAALRRFRAPARLAARGVERPRRRERAHVPLGGAADGAAGRRRRLDLHVLAHARRLHRRAASSAASSQMLGNVDLRRTCALANLPFARRAGDDPGGSSCIVYLLPVRRTGASGQPVRRGHDHCRAVRASSSASIVRRGDGVHLHPAAGGGASSRSTPARRSPGRRGLHDVVVDPGDRQPGRPRSAAHEHQGGGSPRRSSRCCSARCCPSPSRATACSAGTRSRSSWCCRSPCRESSPVSRCRTPSSTSSRSASAWACSP